jgi:hypothetical protein
VNAVENLARVRDQEAFSQRHTFWRGDRDALRVEEGK